MINCDNCGAPVSAGASDTTVTCTHCGHTTQVPQAKSGGGSSGGRNAGGGGGGGGQAIPQIVVVTTSAPQPQVIHRAPPVIVVRRGYRSSGSLFGAILTIMICAGVYWYAMRIRNNVANAVNAAERASEQHEKPKGKK